MSVYEVTKLGFKQYAKLLERRPQPVVVVNDKCKIVATNGNWAKMVGVDSVDEIMEGHTHIGEFLPKYQPSGHPSEDVVQECVKKCHSKKELPSTFAFQNSNRNDATLCQISILPIKVLKKKCAEFVVKGMVEPAKETLEKKKSVEIVKEIKSDSGSEEGDVEEGDAALESDGDVEDVGSSADSASSEGYDDEEEVNSNSSGEIEPEESEMESAVESAVEDNKAEEFVRTEISEPVISEDDAGKAKKVPEKDEVKKNSSARTSPEETAKEKATKQQRTKPVDAGKTELSGVNPAIKEVSEQLNLSESESDALNVQLNEFDKAMTSIRKRIEAIEDKRIRAEIEKYLKEGEELHQTIISNQVDTLKQMRNRLMLEKRNHSKKAQSLEQHLKRRLSSLESEKMMKEDVQIENKKLRRLLKELRSNLNGSLDAVSDLL